MESYYLGWRDSLSIFRRYLIMSGLYHSTHVPILCQFEDQLLSGITGIVSTYPILVQFAIVIAN